MESSSGVDCLDGSGDDAGEALEDADAVDVGESGGGGPRKTSIVS